MLLNVSYNNKETTRKIDEEVGKPFGLMERFRMGGIGSPRLVMETSSIHIYNLTVLDNKINYCNIELRPKGIIVGFRSLLESYVLVIPYYKLTVYKGQSEQYSIYRDDYFVKIRARSKDKAIHKFMGRLMDNKVDMSGTRIEDI